MDQMDAMDGMDGMDQMDQMDQMDKHGQTRTSTDNHGRTHTTHSQSPITQSMLFPVTHPPFTSHRAEGATRPLSPVPRHP